MWQQTPVGICTYFNRPRGCYNGDACRYARVEGFIPPPDEPRQNYLSDTITRILNELLRSGTVYDFQWYERLPRVQAYIEQRLTWQAYYGSQPTLPPQDDANGQVDAADNGHVDAAGDTLEEVEPQQWENVEEEEERLSPAEEQRMARLVADATARALRSIRSPARSRSPRREQNRVLAAHASARRRVQHSNMS